MQRELVDVLQCPTCAYDPLILRSNERGPTIRTGTLVCGRCKTVCPIVDGIPDLLGNAPVPLTPAQIVNYAAPAAWGYERLWRWAALSLLTGEHFPWQRELGLIRALLAPERSGVFVDLACSAGLYARSWASAAPTGCILVGVDHSWAMLREAQRRAANRPISFVRASAQALPLRAGVAAGVGMGGSINEIGDAPAALREIHRILHPDGRFVSMSLVAAGSGWGRLLQRAMASGGIAFPSLEAANRELANAGLVRFAQWRWRVVTITAAMRNKQSSMMIE